MLKLMLTICFLLLSSSVMANPSDLNADSMVDIKDLVQLVTALKEDNYDLQFDLNKDQDLNVLDLIVLVRNFNAHNQNQTNNTTNTSNLYSLYSVKKIAANGGRVDWSHNNNLIAFDALVDDGYYHIYTMNSQGVEKNCITCSQPSLVNKHNGNPAWHPSGEFIVFQSQTRNVLISSSAKPGSGIGNNLFLTNKNGSQLWQLTHQTSPPFGVLHPHFSHDGSMLVWGEFVKLDNHYGVWNLKLATFTFENDVPLLTNIQEFQPGPNPRFIEAGGFSLDDEKIIFTANPQQQAPSGFDIYTIDIQSQQLEQLTKSPLVWDEFPHYQPNSRRIFYVSNNDQLGSELKLDLWFVDEFGEHKKISQFHNPESIEYVGTSGSGIQDYSFNKDGTKIAAYVNEQFPNDDVPEKGAVYLLTLK